MSNNGASQSKWKTFAEIIVAITALIAAIVTLINVIPHFPSAKNSHPTFQVNYLYRPAGQADFQKITDGSELHSGDYYKIWFTPQEDSYVYIFQLDSSRTIHRLFPMESFKGVAVNQTNPVKAGRQYQLPAATQSFRLDHQVGQQYPRQLTVAQALTSG
jgi:hypothetical protein